MAAAAIVIMLGRKVRLLNAACRLRGGRYRTVHAATAIQALRVTTLIPVELLIIQADAMVSMNPALLCRIRATGLRPRVLALLDEDAGSPGPLTRAFMTSGVDAWLSQQASPAAFDRQIDYLVMASRSARAPDQTETGLSLGS